VINRLPLTEADGSLDNVLNLYPEIPDTMPSTVQGVVLQLRLPMKHVDENASLNLGLYSAPFEHGLMLDIDLFVERPVPVGKEVFEILNKIGFAKDDVFEACIKDTIRERIK
jgi:uncharacterized protein (TIGR04255 family)